VQSLLLQWLQLEESVAHIGLVRMLNVDSVSAWLDVRGNACSCPNCLSRRCAQRPHEDDESITMFVMTEWRVDRCALHTDQVNVRARVNAERDENDLQEIVLHASCYMHVCRLTNVW
jgi:hypothetical protein